MLHEWLGKDLLQGTCPEPRDGGVVILEGLVGWTNFGLSSGLLILHVAEGLGPFLATLLLHMLFLAVR